MKRTIQSLFAVILTFFMVSESFAVGSGFISNEVPSARAAGQGFVGVAGQNDDPTTVYTNPAAITNLKGTQATVGATWENIHGGYKDNSGNETKERVVNAAVPNISVTQSFLDGKLGAGLSVQSPFGLETHWDGNSPLRYVATNTALHVVDVTPAVAYQVLPMFSVGAGVDYVNIFDAQLERAINSTVVNSGIAGSVQPAAADSYSSLKGQAADWGYHAGIVVQPNEKNAIGVTYHSKVNLRINGNVTLTGMSAQMAALFGGSSYSSSAYADLVLPANVQVGYAFKPNDKWILEADAAWFHWSEGQNLNVRFTTPNPSTLTGATQLAVLNGGNPVNLTPRDAWSFNTGANYKLTDRWQVRGGFWYEPWAIPEANFSPAFMDLSRYGLSTGAGYALTEHFGIDAAYTAVFMHNRTINNNVGNYTSGIPGYTTNGVYSDFANVLTLNFTYKFGGK